MLLGAVAIGAAAVWRYGATPVAWRRALAGAAAGATLTFALGTRFGGMLATLAGGVAIDDPQGAIAFLPAFQVGLYAALCVAIGVAMDWRAAAGARLG